MKKTILLSAVFLLLLSSAVWAAESPDFLQFYPIAYKVTQSPPLAASLQVQRQGPVDRMTITILATGEPGTFVGTFTKKPVDNIEKYLSLRLGLQPKAPEPIEWVYLFDRNGDGLFDYMCWPVGPLAVELVDFAEKYPKSAGSDGKMTQVQFDYYMKNMKFVFWHFADEDFDGKLEVALYPVLDTRYPGWVEKWVTIRWLQSAERFEAWFFTRDIRVKTGDPQPIPGGYRFMGMGKYFEFTNERLDSTSEMLAWFNKVR